MAKLVKSLERAIITTSCEDSNTVYVDIDDTRYVFRNGEYDGWYNP